MEIRKEKKNGNENGALLINKKNKKRWMIVGFDESKNGAEHRHSQKWASTLRRNKHR